LNVHPFNAAWGFKHTIVGDSETWTVVRGYPKRRQPTDTISIDHRHV
jgi:hypothetical protein